MGWFDRLRGRAQAPAVNAEAPAQAQAEPVRIAPMRRSVARALSRMFDAAKTDRLTASWPTTPEPVDVLIRKHQRVIVARSRQQAGSNDYMRSFLRSCASNIVGPQGIVLQAQARDPNGRLDQAANEAIENAWWEWGRPKNASVTGQDSWRALQRMAVITAAQDGEFFARLVTGDNAGPWGFAVQLIDPQRCPVDHDVERLNNGNFVRAGVEMNAYGRPVAYHFTTTDEREEEYRYGGRAFVRVPAEQILHGFVPWLTGQKRGLPWACTALYRMQHLDGFEKAAVTNARIGASKMGFFTWRDGYGPEEGDVGAIEIDAEPGTMHELPPGVDFKEYNPAYPNGEFAAFTKSMLRGVAAGMGVAYNSLAQDLEGVNFSSIRSGTLEERENWKELQQWLIEALVEPVFEAWLPRALLGGRIKTAAGGTLKPERLDKYRVVEWQPRRWQWVDPRADVQAAVDSKNNLLLSPSEIIRDQGRDPNTVFRQIAADIEAMRAAGIGDEYILASMGQQIAPQPTGGPADAADA
jgi:lambda family phage portal protein